MSNVEFTMGALALKLLGKNLYSNPWSALSELVANGIDAGASKLSIIFDKLEEKKYDIYVIDNGSGMNEETIQNYARIGYQRRKDHPSDAETVMGRKGIGKLAALFLSNKYSLITKTKNEAELSYEFDFDKYNNIETEEENKPSLVLNDSYIKNSIITTHIECESNYTCIYIKEADLSGYGDKAFESLRLKLGNLFSYNDLKTKIFVEDYINGEIVKIDDKPQISEVEKRVPFKNFMKIYSVGENHINKIDLEDLDNNTAVKVFAKDRQKDITRVREDFDSKVIIKYNENQDDERIVETEISGWIASHATIDNTKAEKNDVRFNKNKFYNPIQLRIYVRNKLALENFHDIIGSTQTYSNYIEGEIHYDYLDDNHNPDISTTNRQALDENDIRVIALKEKITEIVNQLITDRKDIVSSIEREIKTEDDIKKNKIKEESLKTFRSNILYYSQHRESTGKTTIDTEVTEDILGMTDTLLQKEGIEPKSEYLLFFSHKKTSKAMSDLVINILEDLGMEESERFYTSSTSPTTDLLNTIRDSIKKKSTMCVYFFSKFFRKGDYAIFEAGAGWAVKTVQQIYTLTDDYKYVPKFEDFKFNQVIEFKEMNVKFINSIINMINIMIEHLNKGRRIYGTTELKLLQNKTPLVRDSIESYLEKIDPIVKENFEYHKDKLDEYFEYFESHNESEEKIET